MTEINIISSDTFELTSDERAKLFRDLSVELGISIRVFDNIERTINKQAVLDALLMVPNLLMLKIRQIAMYNNILPIVVRKTDSGLKYFSNIIFQNQQRIVYYSDIAHVSNKLVTHVNFTNISGLYTNICNTYNSEVSVCGFIFLPDSIMNVNELFELARDLSAKNLIRTGNCDSSVIDTILVKPHEASVSKLYDSKIWQYSDSSKKYIIFNSEAHANSVCDTLIHQLRAGFIELLSGSRHLYIQDLLNYCLPKYSGGSIPKKKADSTPEKLSPLASAITDVYIKPAKKSNIENDLGESVYYQASENILDIAKQLSVIFPGRIDAVFESSLWFDMIRTGMPLVSELMAAEHNHDFKDVTAELSDFIKRRTLFCEAIKRTSDSRVVSDHKFYQNMLIEWYYIKTFGIVKYRKTLEKIPVGLYKLVKFIDYADKKDADITLLNMERDQTYQEALNSDGELKEFAKLLDQLNRAESDISKIHIYSKIRDLIPEFSKISVTELNKDVRLTEVDWIRTKSGFPILCPHARDFYELTLESEKYNQHVTAINEFLMRNYGRENTNYCRICGALIIPPGNSYSLTSGLAVQGYSRSDDELKQYIWKYVRQVISYNIEFKHLKSDQDIKSLVAGICDGLYTFVSMIEKNLNKIKTMSDAEIEARKRLFTTVYIFAFLIRIVSIHYTEIRFRYEIYDRASSKRYEQHSPQKLTKYAISAIMSSQNTVMNTISQIAGETITENYIQNILTKSYDNITSIIKDVAMGRAEPIDYTRLIVLDPRYKWLAQANIISAIRSDISITTYKNIVANNVDPSKILGTEPDGSVSLSFLNAKNPFPAVKYNTNTVLDVTNKYPYHKALAKLSSIAYEYGVSYMLDYAACKFYEKQVWDIIITREPNLTYNTSLSGDFAAFYEIHKDADLADRALSEYIRTYNLSPFIKVAINKRTIRFGEYTPKDSDKLALKYGAGKVNTEIHKASGEKNPPSMGFHKHVWSLAIYGKDILPISTTSDIAFIKSNTEHLRVTDVACGICYNKYSDIISTYTDVHKDLQESQNITSFYNYYSYCCPMATPEDLRHGNMFHNFIGDKCPNCDLTQEMISQRDVKYFNKHKASLDSRFQKRSADNSIPITYKPQPLVDRGTATNWKYSSNVVNEFCALMYPIYKAGSGLPNSEFKASSMTKNEFHNLFINVGLTKDYVLDEIKNGRSIPYTDLENPQKCLERRNMLHPLIQNIVSDISLLCNIKNIASIPLGLQAISDPGLSKISVTKIMESVSGKLELGQKSYYEISKGLLITYHDSPITIANISLSYLLYLITETRTHMQTLKISEPAICEFMLYIIHGIILNIDISCRLSSEKMAIVAASSSENIDPNLVDNRAEMSFDDLVDPDATSQFTYDNIDYDGKNDEGAD